MPKNYWNNKLWKGPRYWLYYPHHNTNQCYSEISLLDKYAERNYCAITVIFITPHNLFSKISSLLQILLSQSTSSKRKEKKRVGVRLLCEVKSFWQEDRYLKTQLCECWCEPVCAHEKGSREMEKSHSLCQTWHF